MNADKPTTESLRIDLGSLTDDDDDDDDDYDKANETNSDYKEDSGDELIQMTHIKTLKRLREILDENKELKYQINILQKHLEATSIQQDNREFPTTEHFYLAESLDVRTNSGEKETQTDQPEEVVDDFEVKYNALSKEAHFTKMEYENELKRVDEENDRFKSQIQELIKSKNNLIDNVNTLTTSLNEVKQHNMEVNHRLRSVLEENKQIMLLNGVNDELLAKIREKDHLLIEQERAIYTSKDKVSQLEMQIEKMTDTYQTHLASLASIVDEHSDCKQIIKNLEEKLENQQVSQQNDQYKIGFMSQNLDRLKSEIEILTAKLKDQESNTNFREFINLKRELAALKEEQSNSSNTNCALTNSHDNKSSKVPTSPNSATQLPPLKDASSKKKKGVF